MQSGIFVLAYYLDMFWRTARVVDILNIVIFRQTLENSYQETYLYSVSVYQLHINNCILYVYWNLLLPSTKASFVLLLSGSVLFYRYTVAYFRIGRSAIFSCHFLLYSYKWQLPKYTLISFVCRTYLPSFSQRIVTYARHNLLWLNLSLSNTYPYFASTCNTKCSIMHGRYHLQ